jgi:hypothetical protein
LAQGKPYFKSLNKTLSPYIPHLIRKIFGIGDVAKNLLIDYVFREDKVKAMLYTRV